MITTPLSIVLCALGGIAPGPWRATLASPLGELPFGLAIESRGETRVAVIQNGEERIERPLELGPEGSVRIDFPHYDSRITAQLGDGGTTLAGAWTKLGSNGHEQRMDFQARAGTMQRFEPVADSGRAPGAVVGRWSVRFDGDAEPAVLVLRAEGDRALATFLTATGDHRFLEGSFQGGRLRLSCFDGAHAFLYDAQLRADGTLAGSFASGPKWQQSWTARRDDAARIPDEYAQAHWSSEPGLLWIEGVDGEGQTRRLGEFLFDARALVVQVAGSWCPNCHDELAWLAPIARELEPKGLRVVTLGFEATGDAARDSRQLARMRERHGARHAFLLAGTAEKGKAASALGALDRVVAFPTLAILRSDGTPIAVHSGFNGPATGDDHARTTSELRARIDAALREPATPSAALEFLVTEGLWRDERDRTFVEVRREGDRVAFVEREMFRFDGPTREEPVAQGFVEARGDVLKIGESLWQFDRRAEVALDPRDLAHRLTPAARGPFPRVGDGRTRGTSTDKPEDLLAALASTDAVLRREATWFLASQIVTAMFTPPDYTPVVDPASAAQLVPRLDDADPLVRATACWAVGVLRVESAIPKLRENVSHPFAAVRREATKALEAMGPPPAAPR
ncbi:MAG: HEAT repeat domain-containing protein [Planctomycetota bacterium]|nr:HEAT repeat domain-containing protein [Planctomycetota bacterium]